MIPNRKIGDIVVCPICGRQYRLTENHKFLRGNDFVCSWDCFMGKPNKIEYREKFEVCEQPEKKKRGRPRKNADEVKFREEILF